MVDISLYFAFDQLITKFEIYIYNLFRTPVSFFHKVFLCHDSKTFKIWIKYLY